MNKQELIQAAADATDLSRAQVAEALDAVLDTITQAMKDGEKVTLTGFGSFEARERAARTARNPQTGEPVEVPAGRTPAFKPGGPLKDAVN